jgi:type IV secretory pathway TrbF-like protein
MLPVAGHARSFEVEWEERAYNQQGYQTADQNWKAILKIAVLPPQDIQNLRELRNPLGIFIEEVQWSERVTERRSN